MPITELRRCMRAAGFVAMLSTACAAGSPLLAQAADAAGAGSPYSRLTVGVAGAHFTSSGRLAEYWAPGNGARLDIHTPFHIGELGVAATIVRFGANTAEQPDFRAYLVGLDWRFALPSSRWLRPSVALAAGDFLTTFDGTQVKGLGKESEVYVGGTAALGVPLAGGTSATASFTALQVLTSTPIRLSFATVGIAHAFMTPRWIRGVIE